ncbi:MAG: hypothetical protein IJZ95_03750 [Oscillospiraceae bacterium]|nr:hypothetical protein [Oscillospiraceae bacterium]
MLFILWVLLYIAFGIAEDMKNTGQSEKQAQEYCENEYGCAEYYDVAA